MRWLLWGVVWAQSAISWEIHTEGPSPARPGDTVSLVLHARIASPYHLYSSKPPAVSANLPTTFTVEHKEGVEPIKGLLERGAMKAVYDEIFGTEVYYYEGEVAFVQRFIVKGAPAKVSGYLRYQYCDEQQCFTERKEVDVEFPVQRVAEKFQPPKAASLSLSTRDTLLVDSPARAKQGGELTPVAPLSLSSSASASSEPEKAEESLWWLFIRAFLFGLAAVLTPCTFPMIPLTVSYFTKVTEGKRGFPIMALWYGFSVVLIFWVLGLLLTGLFGASATYNLATDPWLNLIFFIILVVFGLSFLGLFEITLPASWSTTTARYANPRSLGGVFFMALTLVLVSFSCIGPLVGTLMIEMVGGRIWEPMVGMTGFGLAFALPFSILAGIPQALQRLPRSGEWMNTFKVTLGFLELALALKFLSNADLVWHLGILDREVYLVLWITLFLFLSLYLLGKIPLKGANPKQEIGVGRLLLSMGSFALALYLFTGLWGAPLKFFSGLLPPIHDEMGVRVIGGSLGSSPLSQTCSYPPQRKYADKLRKHTPPDFCAFYDLYEARLYAAQVNKPLLIDFTGHTCTNCRQVENTVWIHPVVKSLINEKFILVSLFVDDETPLDSIVVTPEGEKLRTVGDQWLYLEKSRFHAQAQPYYVITDTSLSPLLPPLGFTLDVEKYTNFLQEGLRLFLQRQRS
ncbi:MAG: protein-disulfide reductase DsbD family protein [Bacteroidia bacterium]|nr:protein-disulfide reductase DsbD family protein [Bacteroidia bacterium]MDW8134624.1 protein-disulfide reductase DsbD family protein [Bacteroidia bacterium]